MNPMSLLTLPASTLQQAQQRGESPSPVGESSQRVLAYRVTAVVMVLLAVTLLPI